MTIDTQWHYTTGKDSTGPRTADQMRALIGQGVVTARTLVWSEGMAEWAQAEATDLRGFFAKSTPPPLPASAPVAGFAAMSPLPADAIGPAPWMGFAQAIGHCFANYVRFSGRASRSQYWFFVLFLWLTLVGLLILFFAAGGADDLALETGDVTPLAAVFIGLTGLFHLATLLPMLAVTSRRMHDAGWSFWWVLVGFVPYVGGIFLLVLTMLRDPLSNRFDAA